MRDRKEFSTKVKVRRINFVEFKCEGIVTRDDGSKVRCGAALAQGRVEYDHDIADNLGGDASFENCRALCLVCHRLKYPYDAEKIARARRQEAAHLGAKPAPAKPIESKGFPPSAKGKRAARPAVPGMSNLARRYGVWA